MNAVGHDQSGDISSLLMMIKGLFVLISNFPQPFKKMVSSDFGMGKT
jgi:hypothetical protein